MIAGGGCIFWDRRARSVTRRVAQEGGRLCAKRQHQPANGPRTGADALAAWSCRPAGASVVSPGHSARPLIVAGGHRLVGRREWPRRGQGSGELATRSRRRSARQAAYVQRALHHLVRIGCLGAVARPVCGRDHRARAGRWLSLRVLTMPMPADAARFAKIWVQCGGRGLGRRLKLHRGRLRRRRPSSHEQARRCRPG